jgi:hypothetical protein
MILLVLTLAITANDAAACGSWIYGPSLIGGYDPLSGESRKVRDAVRRARRARAAARPPVVSAPNRKVQPVMRMSLVPQVERGRVVREERHR